MATRAKPRPFLETFNFDGCGINGPDEYRARLATLTPEGHRLGVGPMFAAAPVMIEALLVAFRQSCHRAHKTRQRWSIKDQQAHEGMRVALVLAGQCARVGEIIAEESR